MTELMKLNGDTQFIQLDRPAPPPGQALPVSVEPLVSARGESALPTSFDWRNYDGHAYIGGIRDQGACGACYAFGANAAAEGAYNYHAGYYDAQCKNFSESYLIWCLAKLPEYSSHFSGCDGADYEYAELQALTEVGVTFEDRFPYQTSDPGPCTHWNDPVVKFDAWGRVPSNDIEGIKNAIATYGVIDAAVYVTDDFDSYSGGIFHDSNTTCPNGAYTMSNHAIALVGWGNDPAFGDYWILRNSWGSGWGESGYMRIQIQSAAVACATTYLIYSPGPPKAAFYVNNQIPCTGDTVQLLDNSTQAPTAWLWTFAPDTVTYQNGTDHTSPNPMVRLDAQTGYDVTLQVSNAHGSNTLTQRNFLSTCSEQRLRLDLETDNFGSETSWMLTDTKGNQLAAGGPYDDNTLYSISFCLPYGNYQFTILDAWGDGICCLEGDGYYTLTDLVTNQVICSGGEFGSSERTDFSFDSGSAWYYTDPVGNCVGQLPCYTNIQCAVNDSAGGMIHVCPGAFSSPVVVTGGGLYLKESGSVILGP